MRLSGGKVVGVREADERGRPAQPSRDTDIRIAPNAAIGAMDIRLRTEGVPGYPAGETFLLGGGFANRRSLSCKTPI